MDQGSLTVVELTPDIAETAAQLRATYNLRSPDSIQMATAIHEGASFFLTNDARLPSLPGLTVLVLEHLRS
ncbi:PIN domain-containing protein [Microcoleus sp. POL10_C6]|uniref:PIN domain-containing protein n=1 Tax=Microcoleus sp. POL10_C6 TaxID=2818852 RepID=UPI002FCEB9B8